MIPEFPAHPNDKSVEGLRHRTLPVFAVQYHPEAAPGPHDAQPLFRQFLKSVEEGARGRYYAPVGAG